MSESRFDKQVRVRVGMNTFVCPFCKGGTLFVPVSLLALARLRTSRAIVAVRARCHSLQHWVTVGVAA